MTKRDELIEKVEAMTLVEKIEVIMTKARANEVFFEQAAEAILATVYKELSEPTREMLYAAVWKSKTYNNRDIYRAMINASPLAVEKRGAG